MKISLITGDEPHYQAGLVSGLAEQDLAIDVIGGDSIASAPILRHPRVNFKNLSGKHDPSSPLWRKAMRIASFYLRLVSYAAKADSKLLHIQWPNKLVFLDRTILNLYYKMLGKKLVFTAHNVDQDARDGTTSLINRMSLHFQYRIVDHIIVHTRRMKTDVMNGFGIRESKISVVPHGVNCAVPSSALVRTEVRKILKLGQEQRVILFFGLIAPYKGLEHLVAALAKLRKKGERFTLIVAGRIKGCDDYWNDVCRAIEREGLKDDVVTELKHIPDESVEIYFKAADVLVMPYKHIFQSGVLFLAYRFGLPVIASDVGSMKEEIIEGETGFVFGAEDPIDLAKTILRYFGSELYKELESRRQRIRDYANERYSWRKIGDLTRCVYTKVLEE